MSDTNSRATVELLINGANASKELEELKKKAELLHKKMDECVLRKDGAGANKLRGQLERVTNQMNKLRRAEVDVEATMKRLDRASLSNLQKTLKILKKNLKDIELGSAQWKKQTEAIRQVEAQIVKTKNTLKSLGGTSESVSARITSHFNKVRMSIMATVASVTGVMMAGKSAVEKYAAMDQEMANVRKYTGMVAEDVEKLNEEFKKIDTRSSREELNRLAQEAGRLGKNNVEDVLGFVRAADKINVALDDLGDNATLILSKLTGIFGDEERLGTERSLLSVGSVINELSQNCSAGAPYLAEFASRLGGVGAQSGLTIPQIMAYGAVLDSNNQKVEAASTALQQVIVRLYQEPAKYAKAAGLDAKEFTDLVKTDMNSALIEFLSTLNTVGSMDVLSPMFKEMGENGSRSISTLSTLAGHIEEVKKQQIVANEAFNEAISIDEEFKVQNTTLQAELDKSKNRINELWVALGQQLAPAMKYAYDVGSMLLSAVTGVVRFVVEYKQEILTLALAITSYTVVAKAASVATKAWALITSTASGIMGACKTAVLALRIGYYQLTSQVTKAEAATKLFNRTSKASPWGIIAALAVAAAGAVYSFYKRMKEADGMGQQLRKTNEEIEAQAQKDSANEIARLDLLYKKTQDTNLSQEQRIKAIQRLKELYPSYFGDISNEAFLAGKAATQYRNLRNAILETARARGRAAKIEALEGEIQELTSTYESEAKPLILKKNKLYGELMQKGINPENDPSYKLIDNNISILDKKYKVPANQKKALQESLAEQNLEFELENKKKSKGGGGNSSGSGSGKKSPGKGSGSSSGSDKFEAENLWREQQEAQTKIDYFTGVIEYEEYTTKLLDIEIEFYKKQIDNKKATDHEKLKITASLREAEKKLVDHYQQQAMESENKFHNQTVAELKQFYIDGSLSKKSYDDAIIQEELRHQRMLVYVTKEGTKERKEQEEKYTELLLKYKEEKQTQFAELVSKYYKDYELKSVKEKYEYELQLLEKFFEEGLLKAEEYEQMSNELKKKFLESNLPSSANKELSEAEQLEQQKRKELERTEWLYTQKLITEEEYLKAKDNINKYYEKRSKERSKSAIEDSKKLGNEFSTMVIDLYQAIAEIGDAKNFTEGFEKFGKAAQAAYAIAAAAMQSYQNFAKAELDLEVARIEKKYDNEAKLAEGNVYKQKKAERDKQREIAKAKNEAAKKEYAMQIAAAIAQSAMAAISAYSSAAAVPVIGYILAPIAAAMAVAAGAVQIMTIKKQKQAAEASGYMEGGFTPPGDKRKEVGVVHAGEWVAPQEMVNNPKVRPMINYLEFARKNNRLPSLKAEDVTRITTPALMRSQQTSQNIVVESKSNEDNKEINKLSGVIERLNDRLERPFVTINTVSGDYGVEKVKAEYDRLMRNKSK